MSVWLCHGQCQDHPGIILPKAVGRARLELLDDSD